MVHSITGRLFLRPKSSLRNAFVVETVFVKRSRRRQVGEWVDFGYSGPQRIVCRRRRRRRHREEDLCPSILIFARPSGTRDEKWEIGNNNDDDDDKE